MSWDARMRQNARCTRVRHGDAWGTPLPVHQCSVQLFFFFFGFTTCANAAQTWADLHRLRPYRAKPPIQDEIQKKRKKRCKTHRLNLITNPTLSHAFFTSNFSSLSHSFLCSLHLRLRSPSPLWDTQPLGHTHILTLTLTSSPTHSQSRVLNSSQVSTLKSLDSGVKLKLSILVFQFF